jgi:predicted RNA binding protein YcfA (HicA-like mRNA interferase family)
MQSRAGPWALLFRPLRGLRLAALHFWERNHISGKEAAKAFQKAGWRVFGQVGSHLVMVKPEMRVNLSTPQHRELSVGILRALFATPE